MEVTLAFQEELSVLVSLGGGAAEPVHRLGLVVSHALSCQVQLAQHILGILVVRFCRLCEPIYRFGGIFSQHLAGQILLSQPVGGPGISLGRRFFQPADALVRVSDFGIVREKQFPQSILCLWKVLLGRLNEPVFRPPAVRNQQRAVPIELAYLPSSYHRITINTIAKTLE